MIQVKAATDPLNDNRQVYTWPLVAPLGVPMACIFGQHFQTLVCDIEKAAAHAGIDLGERAGIAVRNLDHYRGTERDLAIVRTLAKSLGHELEVVR